MPVNFRPHFRSVQSLFVKKAYCVLFSAKQARAVFSAYLKRVCARLGTESQRMVACGFSNLVSLQTCCCSDDFCLASDPDEELLDLLQLLRRAAVHLQTERAFVVMAPSSRLSLRERSDLRFF
jgi:hypothetical protein